MMNLTIDWWPFVQDVNDGGHGEEEHGARNGHAADDDPRFVTQRQLGRRHHWLDAERRAWKTR